MTFRSPRLLVAAALGAAMLITPSVVASHVSAAPCPGNTIADPITGVCWSQTQGSIGISGTGGTCLPGRLGLCLGALQNSQIPGENLQPQAPAGPNRADSWP